MAAAGDLWSEYLQVLLSRRREPQVPLSVEQSSPVTKPLFQGDWPLGPTEPMESCPRKDVENFYEKLVEENFFLITESGEQGRVPVLLLKLNDTAPERKPVVVILHSSYKCKEWLRPLLEVYASRGYISVFIDSRYHGERATHKNTYTDVWDLIKLADHLSARKDVDPSRIGITGDSLGGMHTWFAAFVDTRYSVVVPIIGFQGFRWAIDNNMWEARVDSIRPLFEGAEDPCCPIAGLQEPASRVATAYEKAGSAEKFKFIVEPGVEHTLTANMVKEASDWFDRFL